MKRSPQPEHTLPLLLRALCEQLSVDVPADTLHRVASEREGEWFDVLAHAAAGCGMRAQWLRQDIWQGCRSAAAHSPCVVWRSDGIASAWWIIDRSRPGAVRVRRADGLEPARWMRPGELVAHFGALELLIARVTAALPGSPLGPDADGRPRSPIRRLLSLLRAERDAVGTVVVFAFAVGILALAPPLAIQVIINWLAFGVLLQPIIAVATVLVLCMLAAAALRSSQRHLVELIQRRLLVRTVGDITSRLIRVRIRSLDRHYGPELVNRFFDVLTLQKATSALLLDGLAAALQALVGLVLLAFYHPVLLAFDVAVISLLLLLIPLGRGAQKTAIKESKAKYHIAGWIEEIARHPDAFKLGGAALGEARTETLLREYLTTRQAHFRVFFRQYIGLQLIQVAIPSALLLLCGWLVLEGGLTLGQLVAAEFIVTAALAGMAKFTDKLETVYDLLAGVDKLGTIIDLPHEDSVGLAGTEPVGPAAVAMRGVRYQYESSTTLPWTLDSDIPEGARALIIGAPGVGKTTAAELIAGLRTPTAGLLLRDGLPITLLRPDIAHADTALVQYDGLFDGTIGDNLLVGRRGVDVRAAWQVLERLNLQDAISALPEGLDTRIAPTGAPLSQTRAQALLVARALLAQPRLLVVDGLLDGLPDSMREGLMAGLLSADTTLVIFSSDARLARFATHTYELTTDGLHLRTRPPSS